MYQSEDYKAVFFSLLGGAETQGCIPVVRGTPCLHIDKGELKYTVVRGMCITSGGAPGLCWRNPSVLGNPGWKTLL